MFEHIQESWRRDYQLGQAQEQINIRCYDFGDRKVREFSIRAPSGDSVSYFLYGGCVEFGGVVGDDYAARMKAWEKECEEANEYLWGDMPKKKFMWWDELGYEDPNDWLYALAKGAMTATVTEKYVWEDAE